MVCTIHLVEITFTVNPIPWTVPTNLSHPCPILLTPHTVTSTTEVTSSSKKARLSWSHRRRLSIAPPPLVVSVAPCRYHIFPPIPVFPFNTLTMLRRKKPSTSVDDASTATQPSHLHGEGVPSTQARLYAISAVYTSEHISDHALSALTSSELVTKLANKAKPPPGLTQASARSKERW